LRVGGGEHIVGVEVAGREGVEVVPPLPELAGFVRVGVQLGVFLGVAERLAKPRIVERYEVFWVLSCGCRGGGGCSGPFLTLPGAGGAGSWWRWGGLARGGWCLG